MFVSPQTCFFRVLLCSFLQFLLFAFPCVGRYPTLGGEGEVRQAGVSGRNPEPRRGTEGLRGRQRQWDGA